MTPVVIAYGGRCADNRVGTRRVKYVSVRDNGYYEGSARYVAVRRSVPRTRYVAVRDVDVDYAPRYVRVRRQQPVYVESGTRYVAVRNYAPRSRVVEVHHRDIGDVSYVATQRVPVVDDYFDRVRTTKVVAVRTVAPRTRYVSVNDEFDVPRTRYVSAIDEIDVPAKRHVVVQTDNLSGAETVLYDTAAKVDDDIAFTGDTGMFSNDVDFSGAAYSNVNGAALVVSEDIESPCMERVAIDDCGDPLKTEAITYAPAYDDVDLDDSAILDVDDAALVADVDVEDACLSPVIVESPPTLRRSVSYVPLDHVDDEIFVTSNDPVFIKDVGTVSSTRYVPVVDDEVEVINADTSIVPVADMDQPVLTPAAVCDCDDEAAIESVSYMPVEDVAVNIAPVKTVTYVPVEQIEDTDAILIADDECSTVVSSVDAEPMHDFETDVGHTAMIDNEGAFLEADAAEVVDLDDDIAEIPTADGFA